MSNNTDLSLHILTDFFSDFGQVDLCGVRVSTHATPMFHAMGVTALADALCCGVEIAVFRPVRPPVVVNAATVLQDVVESGSDWVRTVPDHIEVSSISHSLFTLV